MPFSIHSIPILNSPFISLELPKDITLDGELYGGRGEFQSTVSIVKTVNSVHWKNITFQVRQFFQKPWRDPPYLLYCLDLRCPLSWRRNIRRPIQILKRELWRRRNTQSGSDCRCSTWAGYQPGSRVGEVEGNRELGRRRLNASQTWLVCPPF